MRVKIIGAGSAGNHHAHAARQLGWEVDLVDTDPKALKRTKDWLYVERYGGGWDEAIGLYEAKNAPQRHYDLTIVATPPVSHIALALEAANYSNTVLVEKPLCVPHQDPAPLLGKSIYVGYLHSLSLEAKRIARDHMIVEWRECASYILDAHPWLNSTADTYLHSEAQGGGPIGEHSHGIHLWQYIARQSCEGEVIRVQAHKVGNNFATLYLETEGGLKGCVILDFISNPPIKRTIIDYHVETFGDRQFVRQLEHVAKKPKDSPISIENGIATMEVINAAYRSILHNKPIYIGPSTPAWAMGA